MNNKFSESVDFAPVKLPFNCLRRLKPGLRIRLKLIQIPVKLPGSWSEQLSPLFSILKSIKLLWILSILYYNLDLDPPFFKIRIRIRYFSKCGSATKAGTGQLLKNLWCWFSPVPFHLWRVASKRRTRLKLYWLQRIMVNASLLLYISKVGILP